MKNKFLISSVSAILAMASFTTFATDSTGYVELSGGAGLIGNAFESKFFHHSHRSGISPQLNARIGGGMQFHSNNSSRFVGLNAHLNAYGYADANVAYGWHLSEKTDYSFMLGADFDDRFIVPRMAMDMQYKPDPHWGVNVELAFDVFIAPSAWVGARYSF